MSNFKRELHEQIDRAAQNISRTWPLYSFVTSNPLSGFENEPFEQAVPKARALLGGRGYPSVDQFRQALAEDNINRDILEEHLSKMGYDQSAEVLLSKLEDEEKTNEQSKELGKAERSLNQILEKWLSSFLDEGRSRWTMPGREKGFYEAWSEIARMDQQIPDHNSLVDLPADKYEALEDAVGSVAPKDRQRVFTYHLSALPGWVGYIKQRSERSSDSWSEKYPIDLTDYLAVRLVLANHLGATVVPEPHELDPAPDELDDIRQCFLEAWEKTYREELMDELGMADVSTNGQDGRPDAQLTFCIDTRSEIIRRHIESTGNYETHGYAGFFGVPVEYSEYDQETSIEACPPIVDPEHEVNDIQRDDRDEAVSSFRNWKELKTALKNGVKDIKDNVVSGFSFVEFSGLFYGLGMLGRTLTPDLAGDISEGIDGRVPDYHEVTTPDLNESDDAESGMPLEAKVQYAESAFELMGWSTFAPLVVFVGHTSQTSNNPFDSSLQCGACSGNSGAPNARILAEICNENAVRSELAERGIDIPEDTVFLAGRHNTTTDEIGLFDDRIPENYSEQVEKLKGDLSTAQQRSASERLETMPAVETSDGVQEVTERARDWAQTRPEWGLAGNASFIIGPNRLRKNADLEGRAFLHSYDWEQDPDGTALENIFTGPVVVCQWINHQYYFSAIDNRVYGSGSKITHNPVGNFGVLQGNGGDLMGGLPLQSLMKSDSELQHAPLRILTVVHAPLDRVRNILEAHPSVARLVENNWIHLTVLDPTKNNERFSLDDGESTESPLRNEGDQSTIPS